MDLTLKKKLTNEENSNFTLEEIKYMRYILDDISAKVGINENLLFQPTKLTIEVTDRCNVGCTFCMYLSGSKRRVGYKLNTEYLLDDAIDKCIEFSKKHRFQHLTITGGGEPILAIERVLRLIREFESDRIIINTSGYWGISETSVKNVINKICKVIEKRSSFSKIAIRLSVDEFHQVKVPISSLITIVNFMTHNYNTNKIKRVDVLFRSNLSDDPTINQLLNEIRAKICKMERNELNIILNNGYQTRIIYYPILFSGGMALLKSSYQRRFMPFYKFMKIVADPDGGFRPFLYENGLNLTLKSDGILVQYCGNPKLSVNLINSNFEEIIQYISKDIITRCAIILGLNRILIIANRFDNRMAKICEESNNYADIIPAILSSDLSREIIQNIVHSLDSEILYKREPKGC